MTLRVQKHEEEALHHHNSLKPDACVLDGSATISDENYEQVGLKPQYNNFNGHQNYRHHACAHCDIITFFLHLTVYFKFLETGVYTYVRKLILF